MKRFLFIAFILSAVSCSNLRSIEKSVSFQRDTTYTDVISPGVQLQVPVEQSVKARQVFQVGRATVTLEPRSDRQNVPIPGTKVKKRTDRKRSKTVESVQDTILEFNAFDIIVSVPDDTQRVASVHETVTASEYKERVTTNFIDRISIIALAAIILISTIYAIKIFRR